MGGARLVSSLDTIVLMVPFVAMLVMTVFHLDERLAAPKRDAKIQRFFCGIDGEDRPFLFDPDGKPWRRNRIRQIEGRLGRARGADRGESAASLPPGNWEPPL